MNKQQIIDEILFKMQGALISEDIKTIKTLVDLAILFNKQIKEKGE